MSVKLLCLVFSIFITIPQLMGQTRENTSIIYSHSKPESFQSKAIKAVFSLGRIKNRLEKNMTNRSFSQKPALPPHVLTKKYEVSVTQKQGRNIWTFKPKRQSSSKVILYLHGGAYILNISKFHWRFIDELLDKTQATIIVPDYPLAPQTTYKETFSFVQEIYQALLNTNVLPQDITLMGDSAGGGLVLGFAQQLAEIHLPQPSQLILLSPWLDITMSNATDASIDKSDKMLGIKGLQLAGQAYAGSLPTKDYKVSPLYGSFSGLGQISVFIGTHDLFITDCRILKKTLEGQGIPFSSIILLSRTDNIKR